MGTYSGYGRFVSAMNLVLGLGACSDSDSEATNRDDAVQADASSALDAAQRSDVGAADAAVSEDASVPAIDAAAESAEPAAAPDASKDEPSEPQKEPVDAGHDAAASDEKDSGSDAGSKPPPSEDTFALRVVATGLSSPWEITWGSDNQLWIAERTGRVVRVDPATGNQTAALSLSDLLASSAQDGLLGLALHPQLGQAQSTDFVYVAYTYDADPSEALDRRAKIVRYTYDPATQSLGSPLVLIERLPASSENNAGRLVFGPDKLLYYSIGDQGHNLNDNKCLPIRAQDIPAQADVDNKDWSAYQGKVLRLGLDGSIPEDNPTLAGVRTHIFSYGHRNALGLAFGPGGKLYASEQGPKTDDELNLITAGGNYGWPHVAGYRDDNAYVYGNWSASTPDACDSLTFSDYMLPESVPQELETAWGGSYVTPLRTFYTVDSSLELLDPTCADAPAVCWPTITPSSLDVYVPGADGLQTWGTALLIPSLHKGSVLRVKLAANGEITEGNSKELFKTTNRYRDLAIAPNKRSFYVVTDNDGATSGPASGSTLELEHRGAVLEFSYSPTH